MFVDAIGYLYKNIAKKILFRYDPEAVHARTTAFGEALGKKNFMKRVLAPVFSVNDRSLTQEVCGITFRNPVGLAAGFDYEARLTQILPSLGFGFGSVGTLTYGAYGGNPRPMLGRLPRSRSLMVNKGFKNLGVAATLERLKDAAFSYPVGVSIGRTNTPAHHTQADAVADVVRAFRVAEASAAPFAYYELNISCPNLGGSIEFYEPHYLKALLSALTKLSIARPVFVKMPISKTNEEIYSMMQVIVQYPFIKAVIVGNLQKDRADAEVIQKESDRFPVGNLSGMPCQRRSDELIRFVYNTYGSKIKIIGCGGIFSGEDAYRKIKLGASLVQLITGLVFEGPQLVAQINRDLMEFLEHDGYGSISEAVGKGA